MALKITMEHKGDPKDTEYGVQGLPLLSNGKAISLKEEDELSFYAAHGQSLKDWAEGSEYVKVEGTPELKKEDTPNTVSAAHEEAVASAAAVEEEKAPEEKKGGEN